MKIGHNKFFNNINIIILILGVILTLNACTKKHSPEISYIDDLEQFCQDYNMSMPEVDGTGYYQIDENNILVLDNRNESRGDYLHSSIKASVDLNGKLTVWIIDSVAVSESNISGSYAVLITSEKTIPEIEIKHEGSH